MMLVLFFQTALVAQGFHFHKTESQLSKLTPELLVKEFCQEFEKHHFSDHQEYKDIVEKYIFKQGIGVLSIVNRKIEQFAPGLQKKWNEKKASEYEGALTILINMDMRAFRLRGYDEGRKTIAMVKQSRERIDLALAAKKSEYTGHVDAIRSLSKYVANQVEQFEGIHIPDPWIRDTLWFRYDITLSEDELLSFINFLIAKDPTYPSWCQTETYNPAIHGLKKSDASNRTLFGIVKNPEPIYKLYQEFFCMTKIRADLWS